MSIPRSRRAGRPRSQEWLPFPALDVLTWQPMSGLNIEDEELLLAYLEKTGHLSSGKQASVRTLSGGVSNRTVWVDLGDGRKWVFKQALPKLRVEVDWFSNPLRIHREAQGLRLLSELLPAGSVTRFLFEDESHHVMAMEAVPEPHENWKTQLLRGEIDFQSVTRFGRMLAQMHCGARPRAGKLRASFGDRSFFETLRLEPYYGFTARRLPEADAFLNDLIHETLSRQETIVHGDFSPKNILVHRGRLVLLDHEVIHLGDPAFDVGFSLTHFLSKAHHLKAHREAFLQVALHYWRVYWEESGVRDDFADLEPRAVRHSLGCLLARVRGRSTLEYLSETAGQRQARVCLQLIATPARTIPALIGDFSASLNRVEQDGI